MGLPYCPSSVTKHHCWHVELESIHKCCWCGVQAQAQDVIVQHGPNVTDELVRLQGMINEIRTLKEFMSAIVGNETPGDTLMRLSKAVRSGKLCNVDDWCDWMEDFGRRMNLLNGFGHYDGKDRSG